MVKWNVVKKGCPRCGAQRGGPRGLHWHSLSVWCLGCGWGANWENIDENGNKIKNG